MRTILKTFILVCIQFFILSKTEAQNLIVFEESLKINLDYRYDEMSSKESFPNLLILKFGNITAPTRDSFFGFSYIETKRIIKISEQKYEIVIEIDSVKTYNKLHFKEYKLEKLIFPNILIFNTMVTDLNNNKNYYFESRQHFNFKDQVLIDTILIDSFGNSYFKIIKSNEKFEFEENLKSKIEKSITTLILLDSINQKLHKISSKLQIIASASPAVVRIYNIDLKQIESELNLINPRKRIPEEIKDIFEEEMVILLYDSINQETKKARNRFDIILKNPEIEYFNTGIKNYNQQENDQASQNFSKAISIKKDYLGPYYYLALMSFLNQNYDSTAKIIIFCLNEFNNEIEYKDSVRHLGNALYKKLIKDSKENIKIKKLNEAIRLLEIALQICSEANNINCDGEALKLMQEAKQEMFDSWTSISLKSIENRKVNLSINYLNWTNNYLNENREYVLDSTAMDSLRFKLIPLLIKYSQRNLFQSKYTESLYYSNLADSLINISHDKTSKKTIDELKFYAINKSKPIDNINESTSEDFNFNLLDSIDFDELIKLPAKNIDEKYAKNIQFGIEEFKIEKYDNAYTYFKIAQTLQTNYDISSFDSLSYYMAASGKEVILNDLKSGDLYVWGFHFDAVNTLIKMAKNEAKIADIENDTDINQAIIRLEQMVLDNKCQQASNEFTNQLQTASKSVYLKNFIAANDYWNKALQNALINSNCNLDSTVPTQQLKYYFYVIDYQRKILEIENLIKDGKDSLAISKTLEINQTFTQDSINKYQILRISPESLSQNNPNNQKLQYYFLKYNLEKGNIEQIKSNIDLILRKPIADENIKISVNEAVKKFAKWKYGNSEKQQARALAKYYFPNNIELRRIFVKNYK